MSGTSFRGQYLSVENIHHAEHIARSSTLPGLANPALEVLGRILERGRQPAASAPTSTARRAC